MLEQHIENAISKSLSIESDIDTSIYEVKGFSTNTMRMLFHELTKLDNCNYLEVGLYCGATFVSSFNQGCTSIGIEDFSQPFGVENVEHQLMNNISKFSIHSKLVEVINSDCYKFHISELPPIDIFFFDGEHSEESQQKALPYYFESLKNKFIFIVDDYNWESVRKGTEKGLQQHADKIEVVKEWKLRGLNAQDDEYWHNGLYIALINKKTIK